MSVQSVKNKKHKKAGTTWFIVFGKQPKRGIWGLRFQSQPPLCHFTYTTSASQVSQLSQLSMPCFWEDLRTRPAPSAQNSWALRWDPPVFHQNGPRRPGAQSQRGPHEAFNGKCSPNKGKIGWKWRKVIRLLDYNIDYMKVEWPWPYQFDSIWKIASNSL